MSRYVAMTLLKVIRLKAILLKTTLLIRSVD